MELTGNEGLRERAEESLGRERIRLHMRFHDLLTQAAEANDRAGNLARILWRRSSLISLMSIALICPAFPLALVFVLADEDDFSIVIKTPDTS